MSSSENEKEINEQSSDDEEVQSGEEAEEDTDNDQESGAEEPDINASATESDDDDEVDDDEDVPASAPATTPKVKATSSALAEKITKAVKEQNEKRIGRQLYIRFPEKLPDTMEEFQKKVKALSDLIVQGIKPRQKHARFCLVDFASTEDRDTALKQLSKNDSKMVVSLPKVDNKDFIKTVVQKKIQKAEKKRAKNLLRIQSKKTVGEKIYTPILSVLNLPSSASNAQIKELFPDAVDIHTKSAKGKFVGKMIATVTLPSTEDARKNAHKKLTLGGNQLVIKFNTAAARKANRKKNKNAPKSDDTPAETVATPKSDNKKSKTDLPAKPAKLPKKRSISENGDTAVPEKKANVEVMPANAKEANKGKQFVKGKKPMPGNKNKAQVNQAPNGKQGGKPNNKQNKPLGGKPNNKQNKPSPSSGGKPNNKQNKQKNQPQKKGKGKGKGVVVPAE